MRNFRPMMSILNALSSVFFFLKGKNGLSCAYLKHNENSLVEAPQGISNTSLGAMWRTAD